MLRDEKMVTGQDVYDMRAGRVPAGKETSDHVMDGRIIPPITPSPDPSYDVASQECDGLDHVVVSIDRHAVTEGYDDGSINEGDDSCGSEADFQRLYDGANESRGDEDRAAAGEDDELAETDMIRSARPQRRRAPPDRFMHAGRLGDQFGLA